MSWQSFRKSTIHISAIVAIFNNLIIFLLICKHSPKSLGSYKYLMVTIALFELWYAILDMLIAPDHHSNDSGYMIFIEYKEVPLPRAVTFALYLSYWTSFAISFAIFGVHFIFRFLVLSGHKEWTVLTPTRIILWLLVPLIFGVVHTFACRYFLGPSEITKRFLREDVFNNSLLDVEEYAYMGPIFFPEEQKGLEHLNWNTIFGAAPISIIMTISSSVMLFFGGKCYFQIRKLSEISNRSARFRSVEVQLFAALVLQTIIPFALMHIPCTILLIFCFFDSASEVIGRTLCITISLYPVLDPLPNIFVIDPYRHALFKYVAKLFCLKTYANKITTVTTFSRT